MKTIAVGGLVTTGLLVTLAGQPAFAQSDQWNALYDRIIRLEAEVRAGNSAGQTSAVQGNDSFRLNALEEQIRQLAVQVRQMQQQVHQMQAQLAGNKQGSVTQPVQQPWAQQQVIIPQQQDESLPQQGVDLSQYQSQDLSQLAGQQPVFQNSGSQQQAQAPQVLGQLAVQPLDQGQNQTTSSLLPEKVETASLDGNQISGSQGADDVYQNAYQSLLGRDFSTAEAGFRTFLTKYPDNARAGDALYWLGETYFAQADYKQAAQNFLQGYRTYPSSEKAPDSLLKLGMSLGKLGQKPKACGAYAEVTRKYATAAAVRNQALQEMKRAGC